MVHTMIPSTPGILFSSKELRFLKTDSKKDKKELCFPKEYVSDLLYLESAWLEAFTKKLNKSKIPDNRFACTVFRLSPLGKKTVGITASEQADSFLAELVSQESGIWGRISDTVFIAALWELEERDIESRFKAIKTRLSSALSAGITMGISQFPFNEFSREDTAHNAVKALDHAAFFGTDSMVLFDDISLNISGDRLYQAGRIEAAANEYQKGLTINPGNFNLLNSLGVCFGLMNNLDMAAATFDKALAIDNGEVMSIYNAGLAFSLMGETAKGLQYLQKASSLDSTIYEVELATGELLLKEKKFQQALIHMDRATILHPEASAPFRIMGDIYLETGKIEKAGSDYKRAVKLNPSNAAALSGLARVYEKQNKNLDIAFTFAFESVSLEPDNPDYRIRLARIYDKQNQPDLAKEERETAQKLNQGLPAKADNPPPGR